MIVQRVTITGYDKERNTCQAKLQNGDIINLDPFVGCAIELSNDDYLAGKGAEIVGKTYLMTSYIVYHDLVVACDNGMAELEQS